MVKYNTNTTSVYKVIFFLTSELFPLFECSFHPLSPRVIALCPLGLGSGVIEPPPRKLYPQQPFLCQFGICA